MATIEYGLFRAKFIRPPQRPLFGLDLTAGEVFQAALNERPSMKVREGHTWHIGNLAKFSDSAGYFAIGRTTKATVEKFDKSTGNFSEEELEESPHTHCVFDATVGLIGIARKPLLARTTAAMARRLKELLTETTVVARNAISVEILPIPDPEGFLRALLSAYRVTRFSATFHGPNPFDADEYFQRPLSVYLSEANGSNGKTVISGHDLKREVLAEVTRSTAATGNEASARVQRSEGDKPTTISLRGEALKRTYSDGNHDPKRVIADLQDAYYRVRKHERG